MTLEEAIYHTETRKKMVQSTCFSCWSEDAEMGLQALYFMKKMQWIPVSERLPEDNRTVLVTWQDGFYPVHAAFYENRMWYICDTPDDPAQYNNSVTAWMPLPEPYRAERKEE